MAATQTVTIDQLGGRREHEVFTGPVSFTPWQRCQHGKQIATVTAHWSDDAPFTVTTGQRNSTQRFPRTVHIDGSTVYEADDPGRVSTFEYNVIEHCQHCGAFGDGTRGDVWRVDLLAYGNLATCQHCGHEDYHSIGD